MTRACMLVTLIALSTGCRERNPKWLGPASETSEGSGGSTTSATTTPGSTSTDPSTGGTTTTAGSESSTGVGPIPCNNDNQCSDGFVCGPQGCQAGNEGEPCNRARDCGETAPLCSSAGICQDGSPGDPCSNPGDCVDICEGEVCVQEASGSSSGGGSTG